MKGSKVGKPKSAKPYSSGIKTPANGSYFGKTKDGCGASANKPGKSGNCRE